jgi:hypothetical protein
MSDQLTPEQFAAENALICEKLLGLTKHCDAASCPDWRTADGKRFWSNPTFDNWSDAGLILDALQELDAWDECSKLKFPYINPEAIRDAALDYIRSHP